MSGRAKMQAAAERLRDAGMPYYGCDDCKGPVVVDEDGCCVYCGGDTVLVNAVVPPTPKEPG